MKIALTGKICSGKSFVSNMLVKEGFSRVGFGDGVKKYCNELFDMKQKNRKLLQDFAQSLKEIDKNVWINYLDKYIRTLPINSNIVVDDLRFPNELNYLKKNGFIIIKLDVNYELQIERIKKTYPNDYLLHINRLNDISESYINDFEYDYLFEINSESESNIINSIKNIINTLHE